MGNYFVVAPLLRVWTVTFWECTCSFISLVTDSQIRRLYSRFAHLDKRSKGFLVWVDTTLGGSFSYWYFTYMHFNRLLMYPWGLCYRTLWNFSRKIVCDDGILANTLVVHLPNIEKAQANLKHCFLLVYHHGQQSFVEKKKKKKKKEENISTGIDCFFGLLSLQQPKSVEYRPPFWASSFCGGTSNRRSRNISQLQWSYENQWEVQQEIALAYCLLSGSSKESLYTTCPCQSFSMPMDKWLASNMM